jgi:CO dehydrogenase/acetyl-CoA synthase beta subunit
MSTQKKNGKVMTPKDVKTEEDFKEFLRQTNNPFAELIIKAREETIERYGRLLTEKEVKELILER